MAKAILGGLLSGAGKGLVARGENQREEAAAMREEALKRARERRERLYEQEQATTKHERERGLLSRTVTGDDGKVYGITRGGDTKDLGITAATDGGGSGSGSGGSGQGEDQAFAMMSAEEKRTYEEIKNRYTNPNTGTVDWQNFISHLRDMPAERGGERWNEFADLLTGSVGTRMTREEAREQARKEANQRKGLLTPRENEFPETDGDQQAWIKMRTNELLGGAAEPDGGSGRKANGVGSGYGKRQDGTEKGKGFFGELNRPDGQVSTELSIGVNIDGKEVEIPALVPTLTRDEVDHLLQGGEVTDAIARKAAEHARKRIKQGKSPFAQPGEQQPLPEGGSGRAGQRPQAKSGQRANVKQLPIKDGEIEASKLVKGQIYDTPKGTARYLGNGEFETVD